jgi:hypothetical protein
VFWWLEEGWEDVVWVCSEAEAVVRAVVVDFFLDLWHVEIASDNTVRHIPWCVHDLTEGFRLETFEDFNVGC